MFWALLMCLRYAGRLEVTFYTDNAWVALGFAGGPEATTLMGHEYADIWAQVWSLYGDRCCTGFRVCKVKGHARVHGIKAWPPLHSFIFKQLLRKALFVNLFYCDLYLQTKRF